MTNRELSGELCIDARHLSRRCSKIRGSYLAWMTREILLRDYERLLTEDRDLLFHILKVIITDGSRKSNVLDDLFRKGFLVYRSDYLNRLAKLYSKSCRWAETQD